jgi:hypothetical protein
MQKQPERTFYVKSIGVHPSLWAVETSQRLRTARIQTSEPDLNEGK